MFVNINMSVPGQRNDVDLSDNHPVSLCNLGQELKDLASQF